LRRSGEWRAKARGGSLRRPPQRAHPAAVGAQAGGGVQVRSLGDARSLLVDAMYRWVAANRSLGVAG
jgi:hypothetical protein